MKSLSWKDVIFGIAIGALLCAATVRSADDGGVFGPIPDIGDPMGRDVDTCVMANCPSSLAMGGYAYQVELVDDLFKIRLAGYLDPSTGNVKVFSGQELLGYKIVLQAIREQKEPKAKSTGLAADYCVHIDCGAGGTKSSDSGVFRYFDVNDGVKQFHLVSEEEIGHRIADAAVAKWKNDHPVLMLATDAMLSEDWALKETKWLGYRVFNDGENEVEAFEIGLRGDGVIVWREKK